MSVTISPSAAVPAATRTPGSHPAGSRGHLADVWARLRRDRAALIGGALVLTIVALAIFAPWLAPTDPIDDVKTQFRHTPPGTAGFLLGADHLGRDILSRLLYGARLSLLAGFLPVIVSALIGLSLGVAAAYYGGRTDMVIMRIMDVVMAFPSVLFAIGIVAALGPGLLNAILALTIVAIPSFARIVRGSILSIKEREFVEAARVLGARDRRILRDHILPNALAPVLVYATLETGRMVIFGAGLSFLGLGVQPPEPEWGAMLADGRGVLQLAPHVATIPGLAIFALTLGLNLFGDGLRDALDPRLRS